MVTALRDRSPTFGDGEEVVEMSLWVGSDLLNVGVSGVDEGEWVGGNGADEEQSDDDLNFHFVRFGYFLYYIFLGFGLL